MPTYQIERYVLMHQRIEVEAESEDEARMIADDPLTGYEHGHDPVETEEILSVEEK